MFVCVYVFVSYISSVTVQKYDTPMAVWHLAKRGSGRESTRVCLRARRTCTCEGRGALIIEAPPLSPPSVRSREARCFSLIHVKEPAGRKGRDERTTEEIGAQLEEEEWEKFWR